MLTYLIFLKHSRFPFSENEDSAGTRVGIHQKLQEKKEKHLAELQMIEEEIKHGKLGGPGSANNMGSGDDGRNSLPHQVVPNVKRHINLDSQQIQASSPVMRSEGSTPNVFNDLNIMSSSNLDDINNLNKYTRNYDPLYNRFGLDGINIPVLDKEDVTRNVSPISSQLSATESNAMAHQIVPRTKMSHNVSRNPFAENYQPNFPNTFAENFIATDRTTSLSPQNTAKSPNRLVNSPNIEHNNFHLNHSRQIPGTYSNSLENNGTENLPFPYNVIPPPKSQLDNRNIAITQQQSHASGQQQSITTPSNSNNHLSMQQRLKMQRAKTPEILLAPHYLDNSRVYYEWVARDPIFRLQQNASNSKPLQHHPVSSGDENLDDHDDSVLGCGQDGYRIPSDIDSQVKFI